MVKIIILIKENILNENSNNSKGNKNEGKIFYN